MISGPIGEIIVVPGNSAGVGESKMSNVKLQGLVAAVVAGFAAGAKLADGIAKAYEPATAVEVCRAIFGEDFKTVEKPTTAAERADAAKYQAVRYARGLLTKDGRWPAGKGKARKPRAGKGKGKAGADAGEDVTGMLAGLVKSAKFADLLPLLLARKDAARLANGLAAGLNGEDDSVE